MMKVPPGEGGTPILEMTHICRAVYTTLLSIAVTKRPLIFFKNMHCMMVPTQRPIFSFDLSTKARIFLIFQF